MQQTVQQKDFSFSAAGQVVWFFSWIEGNSEKWSSWNKSVRLHTPNYHPLQQARFTLACYPWKIHISNVILKNPQYATQATELRLKCQIYKVETDWWFAKKISFCLWNIHRNHDNFKTVHPYTNVFNKSTLGLFCFVGLTA